MESAATPATVPAPLALPCVLDEELQEPAAGAAAEDTDRLAGAEGDATQQEAVDQPADLAGPCHNPAVGLLPPEPTQTDSPTLRSGASFQQEGTPLAVRAAVRDTLAAAVSQDGALAAAAPSVRASADSTAAMAAILRQFTAHLRNQPAPSRYASTGVGKGHIYCGKDPTNLQLDVSSLAALTTEETCF